MVFVNEQINEDMTGMTSSSRITGLGHLRYGFQVSGGNAGANRRFTHLITMTNFIIIFTDRIIHSQTGLPINSMMG